MKHLRDHLLKYLLTVIKRAKGGPKSCRQRHDEKKNKGPTLLSHLCVCVCVNACVCVSGILIHSCIPALLLFGDVRNVSRATIKDLDRCSILRVLLPRR